MKKEKAVQVAVIVLAALAIVSAILLLEQSRPGQGPLVRDEISLQSTEERVAEKATRYPPAVEFVNPDSYINSEPFTLEEYIGKKVILIDFWTYSCINCQRTLPYLASWRDKYADQGLLIVGVHTPEFEFEKDRDNVIGAMERFGVEYPVIQDNDYQTWRAYNNRYWPRKYLIDIDGFIVYDHIGEGSYAETEEKIQELLAERAAVLGEDLKEQEISDLEENVDFRQINTPELYFGHKFYRGNFANKEGIRPDETVTYTLPETLTDNNYHLEGTWHNAADYMELASDTGTIVLPYQAKNVNIVASGPASLRLRLDGEVIEDSYEIDAETLYTVVEGDAYGKHTLTIEVMTPGFRIYTFTFG